MCDINNIYDMIRAVERKELLVLERLTPASANVQDQDGRTLLMHAILAEDADPLIVSLLIDRGADVNAFDYSQKWTALHFAARDQNETLVQILLQAGAAVDAVDVFGNTPLWRSVMNSTANLAAIKELIAHGADPYKKNKHNKAPIDIARETEQADVLALF